MELNGRWFVDPETKRTVLFKGINVGGDTKLPFGQSSHERDGYWVDHDRKVSFIGRPFPLNDADEHLSRLANLGFNLLRFMITWEAVEHEGPGIYDYAYLDYVIEILKKCREYKFKVFINPHQDCWSRHCGGSGHPGWTLSLVGLNPLNFPDTNAAIVHNLYPNSANYPKMIWNTNYQKLAASTLFTLFFAGSIYAPKCVVSGVNIQYYLQAHYYNCFKTVASVIQKHKLQDTVVIGYDTMNEPGEGYLSIKDLTKLSTDDTDFKMGTMPTAFQGMLLGNGIATTVENWEFRWNGPKKTGTVRIDPRGKTAWLSAEEQAEVDRLFNWKRAEEWTSGCIWHLHGLYDKQMEQILVADYFKEANYTDYWIDHVKGYAETIREIHANALLFIQPPVLQVPPTNIPIKRLVYSPHWYDGLTLVKKKWCNYNVDFINLKRGKYGTGPFRFVRALRLGESNIRQCFIDQLHTIQQEGYSNIGDYPVLFGEIGIPYDMELELSSSSWLQSIYQFFVAMVTTLNKSIHSASSSQNRAMDANLNALEANLLNYSLWNYTVHNTDQWGDQWNGEDLSIWQSNVSSSSSTSTLVGITQKLSSSESDYTLDNNSTDSLISASDNARNLVCLHRPHPKLTAGIPVNIRFVSPTKKNCASFEYSIKSTGGVTEIYVPTCYFPAQAQTGVVDISTGTYTISIVNQHFWILLWTVDEQEEHAKLVMTGVSVSS